MAIKTQSAFLISVSKMQIRFKKLSDQAQPPFKASPYAAGYDLVAISKEWDEQHSCWVFGTGLALEIPIGYVGLLFPRSSVFKTTHILANCVGVIDADYRGEVKVFFRDLNNGSLEYQIGERVAQLIILPIPQVDYIETETISETKRGIGGYGSTGNQIVEI